jgi:hypothetical protein
MMEESGAGSVLVTNRSGSGRPRYIRIRIRNTGGNYVARCVDAVFRIRKFSGLKDLDTVLFVRIWILPSRSKKFKNLNFYTFVISQ